MLIVTVILFFYNVELTLITLLMIVPLLLGLSLWFRSASDKGYQRVRDGIASVLSDLSESLSGVHVVTGFNRARHNVLFHRNVSGVYRDANDHTAHLAATYGTCTEFVGLVGQAMLLLIGGNMVRDGNLTIGELTAFILYLNSFFLPIQMLVQQYNLYQQGQAAITKLDELLSTHPTVEESADAEVLPQIDGSVTLEDVSFAYDPAKPVLHDVDLHVRGGRDHRAGRPDRRGEVDHRQARHPVLRPDARTGGDRWSRPARRHPRLVAPPARCGAAGAVLVAGSMRDNIAFARPSATDDEVMEAVHRVGLTELIERLPEGVDTPVHGTASRCRPASGSWSRRPGRSWPHPRAGARRSDLQPRPEVRDEGGSQGLDAVLEGRTAIIVAHRLSTAIRADRIAVVDDGAILELGSHDELVARGGRYAEMFEAWTAHLQEAPEVVASTVNG